MPWVFVIWLSDTRLSATWIAWIALAIISPESFALSLLLGFFDLRNQQEVMRSMLASKTVIYVTHKMESLSDADHILVPLSSICAFEDF